MTNNTRWTKAIEASKANQTFAKRILVSYKIKIEAGKTHFEACKSIASNTGDYTDWIETCVEWAKADLVNPNLHPGSLDPSIF